MIIKEIKNKNYEVEAYKMKNDALIQRIKEPLPNNFGFAMLLVGQPNSGKTTLLLNMLKKTKSKNTYYKKFDKCFIFSNSLHTITKDIMIPKDQQYNGIDELEEVIESIKLDDNKNLIILDDVISDIKNVDYIEKLFFNRRHYGGSISIILTSQVFNKISPKIRKCATSIFIFSTSNKQELQSIWKNSVPLLSYPQFIEICKYCFKKSNHEFLAIDTQSNSFYHNFNHIEIEIKD